MFECLKKFFRIGYTKKVDELTGHSNYHLTHKIELPWENGKPERKQWTQDLVDLIDERLDVLSLAAKDITRFCEDYHDLTRQEQIEVWAVLICSVAYYESGWNPKIAERDVGTTDKNTWSTGLMQMSVCDQKNYNLKLNYTFDDLLTPKANLHLALEILVRQVTRYGSIILRTSKGLYWAVLYEGGRYDKTHYIIKFVKDWMK